ncbi:MAG: hypothetical protein BIFFINMI_01969 [Phycisphaerae bacterium]|nr:hypothetical protein [Phycisphaerae bacterium]
MFTRKDCASTYRNVCALFAVAALMALIAAPAQAAPYVWDFGNPPAVAPTIQNIIDNYDGTFIVGDKQFTNWRVQPNQVGGAVAPDAAGTSIAGVIRSGEYGLKITAGWVVTGSQISDTTIVYKVTALAEGVKIHDNTLEISNAGAANGGIASVSEYVYDGDPDLGANLIQQEYVYHVSPANQLLSDHQEFPEQYILSSVWVQKDIAVSGVTPTGNAHLSVIYQTFSQTVNVPEPATLLLLGLGGTTLAGAGLRRKRMAKA